MKKITRFVAFLLAAMMAFSMAGCGSEETEPTQPKDRTTAQAGAEDGTTAADGKTTDEELVLAMPIDIGTGNGHDYSSPMYVQDWLYDPLTKWEDNQVKPGLAESWDISEDGTEYTFHLRKNVKFTDGTDWDAEICKKNMDAVLLHQADHSWLETLNKITDVEIVDDMSVKVTISSPYYPLLQELSLVRPMTFMAEAAFPESGDTYEDGIEAAIGTGKLKLIEHVPEQYAVFERNDDYWGETVKFKTVRVEVIPDMNTQVAALKSGEIDMIFDIRGAMTADAFMELQSAGFKTDVSGPCATLALAMNSKSGPTADLNVRLAMEHAVDKHAIVEGVYYGLYPVTETLFDPSLPYCDIDWPTYDYDPDKAVTLLEESGWVLNEGERFRTKDGQTLTVEFYYVSTDNVCRTLGEALQSMFAKVGIELVIIGEEGTSFGARQTDGTFHMVVSTTWGNQYDPHSMVASYREPSHADFRAQEGMPNKAELDQWVTDVLVETDEEARQQLYTDIFTEITNQAIYLPICSTAVMVACENDIEGITFNTDNLIPIQTLYRAK